MTIETISPSRYAIERSLVDRSEAYRKRVADGRNYLTAEEAAHPDYAAVDNDMRGRVEQYELLHDTPERFVAYVGEPRGDGMGVDRTVGQTYPITVWTGLPIGYATKGSAEWVANAHGERMSMFYATINGRKFYGRSYGPGMWITLIETPASKRRRAAKEAT